jgi:hypothetical protein
VNFSQSNGLWSILIVTPLMRRVQNLSMAQEMSFLDSTGHLDVTNCAFTAMTTSTKAGAMPLGVFLHGLQTQDNYSQAFGLFKEHYPTGFGGKTV